MSMQQQWQRLLDRLVPRVLLRWVIALGLLALFSLRIYMAHGFYIITYGLGIYLLNLLISFLSPQTDPDFDDDAMSLPTREDDEFRPFVRKLPEYKCWLSVCKAVLFAMALTSSRAFDVPVFWPVLLMYFILLFVLTMKQRIQHMIRHRYVPITLSKPKVVAKPSNLKEFEKRMAV
eukprot:NODE_4266_length_835_cov_46.291349_g3940_i0.p1 GENE.NODE_4266_length_835_cov_46.291349_g3940_i0~~NODE_4266_length_835_cov_46.291349_g3940_i0.p1  ORF type:complete len:176 (+),score=39.60 NODE_4266_length_835_cov_46.291349_g3940_i0:94-621(+)